MEQQAQDLKPDQPAEKIEFKCSSCSCHEFVDYFGKTPPFTKNIEFNEEAYVLKDPFSPAPSKLSQRSYTEYFIVIGVRCRLCEKIVCKSNTCSLFYGSSFCLSCAQGNIKDFPVEIQSRIKKEIVKLRDNIS